MSQCRTIKPREQTLGKRIKRFGVLTKVLQGEDSLGVGQVECGQVGVEACARCAKVGNAAVCGDSGADAEDNVFGVGCLDVPVPRTISAQGKGPEGAMYVAEGSGKGGCLLDNAVEVGRDEDFRHVVLVRAREWDTHQRSLRLLATQLLPRVTMPRPPIPFLPQPRIDRIGGKHLIATATNTRRA